MEIHGIHRHRSVSLVLALLLLLASLAPSVSRALQARDGIPLWAQTAVCRSPQAPADAPVHPLAGHGEACALCQVQRDLPALPGVEAGPGLPRLAQPERLQAPALAGPGPRGPPVWRQPPAHAPPVNALA
ncbi:hypothetical protein JI742_11675 [Piscinibacter sp. Jin2]|uniref:DUF2946 domain-containing protein n=1 Tax=Aquariibacter lacus TaxID=2801332 RepID=A0A9X0XJC6_9BURK|nr:DUF2946 family protein [Piscinibacter lacus]MBL0720545.1 hypothetical protein [Piscinibacter lacus]